MKNGGNCFDTPRLQHLIRHSVTAELRRANCSKPRSQAQAQLGLTRASHFPTLTQARQAFSGRNPKISSAFRL